MIEKLELIDRNILLFFNSHHADWFDPIIWAITSRWCWVAVIIFAIVLLSIKFRKKCWVPILAACICFTITDRASSITKESVKRYRPTHNIEIQDQIHVVHDHRGGMYGFFSGHASNSFGLALLTLLLIRKRWYTISILAWACLECYTRLYMAVHYPSDIIVGTCVGLLCALVFYNIAIKILKKIGYHCDIV